MNFSFFVGRRPVPPEGSKEPPKEEKFAAVSGPSISGSRFDIGGFGQHFAVSDFITASTTVCVLSGPSATSSAFVTLEIYPAVATNTGGKWTAYKTPVGNISTTSGQFIGEILQTPNDRLELWHVKQSCRCLEWHEQSRSVLVSRQFWKMPSGMAHAVPIKVMFREARLLNRVTVEAAITS